MAPKLRPLLAFALLGAVSAGAQSPQPTPAADPEGYRYYTLGTIPVTEEAPAVEVVDVEVVSGEEIELRNARTVAEALVTVPGLRVSTGRKAEPIVSIHGFDQSKILVLIDGVPYYETNYGRLDLNQIPTANIARIEVSKGAASVLYGANAMGGVVNIITKEASGAPTTSASAELGENGFGSASLSHGGRRGRISYWLNYSHQERDGWEVSGDFEPVEGQIVYRGPSSTVPALLQGEGERTNSDVGRDAAWFKLGLDNGPDSEYWINLHYLNMSKGLPPAIDQVQVFLSPPAFSQLARMPDYRDTGVDLDLRQRLAERLVLKGKLFYHDHEGNYDSYPDLDLSDRLARSTFKDSIAGGTAILESPLAATNTLRACLNFKRDTHEEREDEYLPYAETASDTGSAGVEDELVLGSTLRMVLGLSFDWFDVSEAERNLLSGGQLVGQEALPESSAEHWNPMAGVSWSLGADGELFASLGRKSRFPLLAQLYSSRSGNPDLEPEQSLNLVVGYRRRLTRALEAEATGFWYEVSNLISRSGTDPTNTYQNYAEVRIDGLELAASVLAAEGLQLRADLTWTDASDRSDGRVTEEVIHVPELSGNLAVRWQLPWIPARFDLDATYMDEVFTSLPSPLYPDDPVQQVDAVLLLSARLGVDLLPWLELWGAGRNLLDEDYESEYAYPGPGRDLSAGLTARF
jgi:iron complex outermembrane receptor protein